MKTGPGHHHAKQHGPLPPAGPSASDWITTEEDVVDRSPAANERRAPRRYDQHEQPGETAGSRVLPFRRRADR